MEARRALLVFFGLAALAGLARSDPVFSAEDASTVPDVFELRLLNPEEFSGTLFRAWVQVYNPYDLRPLAGVAIRAELEIESYDDRFEDLEVREREGRTDEHGEWEIELDLPPTTELAELDLTVTATYQGVERQVSGWAWSDLASRVILSTDKRLYQPGQMLHARGLWLDADGRARSGVPVELEIRDERDRRVWSRELTTSRFGIAAADWRIPESVAAGGYSIQTPDGWSGSRVRISRYEMAAFGLEVESSRAFYLPGTDAKLSVAVTRIDGTPVAGAEVELDVDSRPGIPVRTDDTGNATLRVGLDSAHSRLAGSSYLDFDDLDVVVTATDPLSRRSERAETAIRVTRYPIHVYHFGFLPPSPGLPSRAWVATYRADGEPAPATVELRRASDRGVLARCTTNVYGVGRLPAEPEALEAIRRQRDLVLTVADAEGNRGEAEVHSWRWQVFGDPALTVSGRTLHRPGEAIAVTITPSAPMERVRVELGGRGGTLATRLLPRIEEPTPVVFPATEFPVDAAGAVLEVRAWPLRLKTPGDVPFGRHQVLYAGSRPLSLRVSAGREVHRPGDDARLTFTVDGDPAAVGVAIVDRGIELRQRGEGLAGPGLLAELPGRRSPSVAGWTVERLLTLDPDEITADLDLLAAYLLFGSDAERALGEDVSSPIGEESREHQRFFQRQLEPVSRAWGKALADFATPADRMPSDEASFLKLLERSGIDFHRLRDPWDSPFRVAVSFADGLQTVQLVSAGRDRAWETIDDFSGWWRSFRYFQTLGPAVDRAVERFFRQTGGFLAAEADLARELELDGLTDWSTVRDPWGRPYRLVGEARGSWYHLVVESPGDPDAEPSAKDSFWTSRLNFGEIRAGQMQQALERWVEAGQAFPADEEEVRATLAAEGLDSLSWLDPDGRPLIFEVKARTEYRDRIYYATPTSAARLEAVTEGFDEILLKTLGRDGQARTGDDLVLGRVSYLHTESQSRSASALTSGRGVLAGTVTDEGGSAIPGALVVARADVRSAQSVTDAKGTFRLLARPGVYRVTVSLDGFSTVVYDAVHLVRDSVTSLSVQLDVAQTFEEIVVTAEGPIEGTSAADRRPVQPLKATPRVRRDFPETLLWLPELVTGENGRAEIDVRLADALTTWQLAALASTADGRFAFAEIELPVSLPFSVEPDLPPLLTVGDEVSVPVYLHNRSPASRTVELTVARRPGFAALAPAPGRQTLEADEARRLDLPLRFTAPGSVALQLTATSPEGGDAVERTAVVRPAGYQHAAVHNALLRGGGELSFEVAEAAVDGSARLEVTVDSDVGDHLTAAIRGLAHRPVGCAEQRTSTAMLNLLLLRREIDAGRGDSAAAARARAHLEQASDALVHYSAPGGGFGYWHDQEGDEALTAYVLELFAGIAPFVDVDRALTGRTVRWLLDRQRQDGGWSGHPVLGGTHPLRTVRITAWVTAVLARWAGHSGEGGRDVAAVVDRALDLLELRLSATDDPYSLAHATLAAAASGRRSLAAGWAGRLRSLARGQGTAYWALESHSPFWGWGAAGRLETTAAAVEALLTTGPRDDLAERGLAYLLLEKDYDGLWYSTQATARILRALSLGLPATAPSGPAPAVLVDGEVWTPERTLAAGRHRLTLAGDAAGPWALTRATVRSVVPWERLREVVTDSPELRYAVDCGSGEVPVERPVTCNVAAERTGCRGDGMMIAEIGLPPGADVDRGSLDQAVKNSGWSLSSYEVWPDRVVAYLWPRAGGVRFDFTWRPRLVERAVSAPAVLYDYYNPEARVVVEPATYRVSGPPG